MSNTKNAKPIEIALSNPTAFVVERVDDGYMVGVYADAVAAEIEAQRLTKHWRRRFGVVAAADVVG